MPEQQIYSELRSHWDNDGDLIPESGSGTDEHIFNIPAGQKFSRYELKIEANTAFSNASVSTAPTSGATGQQKIKVNWNFNPFGKIAYKINVYAGTTDQPVDIIMGTPNAPQQAFDLIKQKKPFHLILSGADALSAVNVFRKAQNKPPLLPTENTYSAAIGWDDVLMAAVICAAIVAVVTLLVILLICLAAMQSHYKVDIQYRRNGPMPFDDTLIINLVPA